MSEYLYVDIDSGTILNGPLFIVPADEITDDMTDSDVIDVAIEKGEML